MLTVFATVALFSINIYSYIKRWFVWSRVYFEQLDNKNFYIVDRMTNLILKISNLDSKYIEFIKEIIRDNSFFIVGKSCWNYLVQRMILYVVVQSKYVYSCLLLT